MPFDIEGARKEGYTDTDIAKHLAETRNFDYESAIGEGYSDTEIADYLSIDTVPEIPQPEIPTPTRGVGAPTPTRDEVEIPSVYPEGSRLEDILITAKKGAVGLGQAIVGLADIPTGGRVGRALEEAGLDFEARQQVLDSYYSTSQQKANRAVAEAEGFTGTIKAAIQNPSTILHTVIESTPMMIGGAGIARGAMRVVPKLKPFFAAAIGEGTIAAGSMAEQLRTESEGRLLSPKKAAIAIGAGAGTGLFGLLGGRIAAKYGFADVDTMLAAGRRKVTEKGVMRRVLEGGITEGALEELPQSAQEQVWMNAANDRPLLEGVDRQSAMGLLAGFAMGGGGNIVGTRRAKLADPENVSEGIVGALVDDGTLTTEQGDAILTTFIEQSTPDMSTDENADLLESLLAEAGVREPEPIPEEAVAPEVEPPAVETPEERAEVTRESVEQRVSDAVDAIEPTTDMGAQVKSLLQDEISRVRARLPEEVAFPEEVVEEAIPEEIVEPEIIEEVAPEIAEEIVPLEEPIIEPIVPEVIEELPVAERPPLELDIKEGLITLDTPNRNILESIKAEVEAGEAGMRVPARTPEGEVITTVAEPSTFPEYFQDKGYKKKPVLVAINKALTGKKLAPGQERIIKDLHEGFMRTRPEMMAQIKRKPKEKPEAPPAVPFERARIGKSPQTYKVLREVEVPPEQVIEGERFFEVQNERTGEIEEVELADLTQVKKKKVEEKPVFKRKELQAPPYSGIFNKEEIERRIEDGLYVHDVIPERATKEIEGVDFKRAQTIAQESLETVADEDGQDFTQARSLRRRSSLAREILAAEEAALSEFAKENDLLIPDFFETLKKEGDRGNTENYAYLDSVNGRWYKANNLRTDTTFSELFNRINLHNTYFGAEAYRFEGFVNSEEGLMAVFSQPNFEEFGEATEKEIEDVAAARLEEMGFKRIDDPVTPFVSLAKFVNAEGVVVSDIHSGNVIYIDGDVAFIDPVIQMDPETKVDRIKEAIKPAKPALKRKEPYFREGLPEITEVPLRADIEATVDILTKTWKNKPPVIVKSRINQLPGHLQDAVILAKGEKDIEGIYDPKTESVYLVAENIDSLVRAKEVLFHETLGHYGIRELLGDDIKTVLNQTYLKYRREAQDIARRYNLDVSKPEDRRRAAEEVLANIAQNESDPGLLKKVFAAIRKWLRKIGLAIKLSDNDLRVMVANASQLVREGEKSLSLTSTISVFSRKTVEPKREETGKELEELPDRKPAEQETFKEAREVDSPASEVLEGVKRWAKRNWTKEGLLNKSAFEKRIEMDAAKNAGEADIAAMVTDFNKAVSKAFGKKKYSDVSAKDLENVNLFLTGQPVDLPKGLKEELQHLRDQLDRLSDGMLKTIADMEAIKRENLSPKDKAGLQKLLREEKGGYLPKSLHKYWNLYETISNNKGSYLTRSYQAFEDPNWKKKTLKKKPLIKKAKEFVSENNPHLTDQEVTGAVSAILQSAKEAADFTSLISRGTKIGAKDVSIITKRKDVPEVIRNLLGEYKDPKINFVRSASKMQHFIANHDFLMGLRRTGLGTFLFENPVVNAGGSYDTKIAGEASEVMNPLNGLYTTEEFRQGLEDASDKFEGSELMRNLIRMNSFVKYGKAQPLDATVYTPYGPTRMGDLQVGDEVCGANVRTKIIGIYPQGEMPVYKITFGDGSSTEATKEHLWEIDCVSKGYAGVFTTEQIMEFPEYLINKRQLSIPVALAVFEENPVPLDPYLVGALLGDGSMRGSFTPKFHTADKEIINYLSECLPDGIIINHPKSWAYCDYTIVNKTGRKTNEVALKLREMGIWGKLSYDKFIPDIYKYNSKDIRLSVAQGLLDTDGWVNRDGQPSFSSASKQLTDDLGEIIESLGGTVIKREKMTASGCMSYELKIRVEEASEWFRLTRKKEITRTKTKPTKRTIKSIEFVGYKECQCIMVDDSRHLYLTDRFIVTHNTILSPTTQARNFMSAAMFSIMNGHFNWSHMGKAFATARSDIFTHDKKWRTYLNKLIKLGVMHDNPYAGELRDAIKDFTELDTFSSPPNQKYKRILDFFQKTYRVGDDFWKIIGYENELAVQKKAGFSQEEAEKRAAQRIRDGYPTYSMVPRGIKQIRRWPLIGTFVSFPYEIARTTKNQLEFIKEDMADPKTKPLAVRRALGLAVASSAAYAASQASMAMMGMDADDDEAIRAQLPEWSRNSQLLYTGYDKNGLPAYLDLSYMDPYTYVKKPVSALLSGNNRGIYAKIEDSLRELLEPFIGADIAAGALGEIIFNQKREGGQVYNPEDEGHNKANAILQHIRKAVQPGVLSNMERTIKAIEGDISRSGKIYDLKDEGLAWIGFRFGTLNLPQSMNYKGYGFRDRKSQSARILNFAIGNASKVSDKEVQNAVRSMLRARNLAYSDMIKLIEGSVKLGMTKRDIRASLRASGVSKNDISYLLRGRTPRWVPSKTFLDSAEKRAIVAAPTIERKRELRQEMRKRRTIVRETAAEEQRKKD